MLRAILFAHQHIVAIVDLIEELRDKMGVGPKQFPPAAAVNPLLRPAARFR